MNEIEQLKHIIEDAKSIVFFGGAGVSTESNIPDFRSEDGIYQEKKYDYPPEVMLSRSFFDQQTKVFYQFYFDKMIYAEAKPNPAHEGLAKLEQMGKLTAVITQNIDGLHQMAGSENVLELHGSVLRNFCMKCKKEYGLEYMLTHKDGEGDKVIPTCQDCGAVVKPDVVLYEESLNNQTMDKAIRHLAQADAVIVGGTSLAVYPAAGLLEFFQGKHLVLINKEATKYDQKANLIIREPIGKVFHEVLG